MGVIIKSRIDGFRRGGIAHRVKGTYHPDGTFTEQQLTVLREDPNLLVVEGVQEDALQADQGSAELLQEMGTTIAALEHDLEQARADLRANSSDLDQVIADMVELNSDLDQARAGLEVASSDLAAALARQKAAPGLIVEAAALLAKADPTQEGVICILADNLAALITEHLQPQNKTPEAQVDGIQPTLSTAGESPSPAPVQAVAEATGEQPEAISAEKVAGKRGAGAARNKGAE